MAVNWKPRLIKGKIAGAGNEDNISCLSRQIKHHPRNAAGSPDTPPVYLIWQIGKSDKVSELLPHHPRCALQTRR